MVRTPCCDKNGLKKGTWTQEEDTKLIAYVTKYGHWNWRLLPKFAGLARCGKSCRLRWLNYLRPEVKRGNFSHEEEQTIVRLHEKLGNRWSAIAAELPGRTDNEIKNHWHTALKKRFQQKSNGKRGTEKETNVSESILLENDCNIDSADTTDAGAAIKNHENSVLEGDDGLSFLDTYTDPDYLRANFWTEPCLIDNSYVPPPESEPHLYHLSPFSDMVELWSHNDLYLQEYSEGFFY